MKTTKRTEIRYGVIFDGSEGPCDISDSFTDVEKEARLWRVNGKENVQVVAVTLTWEPSKC